MAIEIPMNTLLKIEDKRYSNNPIDLNAFGVDGCEWRKPYSITIPQVEGVKSILVTRTASESNCGQLSVTTLGASGTVLYGDVLSLSALPEDGYDAPTVSFASGVSNGKVIGDVTLNIVAGELNAHTVTFTNPSYGVWEKSALTLPYGTEWSISGNAVTFNVPTLAGAITNSVIANSPTARTLSFGTASYGSWDSTASVQVYDYSYTTPTINLLNDKTSGTIMSAITFTASNSRSNVIFTNTTLGTNGTNTTYSGNHKWMISGTNTSGASFSRTFTTTAHDAQFYYSISRNSSATQATSDITFTPTVTRSFHTYTVSYPTKPTGVENFYVYKNGTVIVSNPTSSGSFTASYGDTVYATATATTGYNNPTISGVGTSSSAATTITSAKSITLTAGLIKTFEVTYPAMPTGVSSFSLYVNGTRRVYNPTSAGSVTVNYGAQVYAAATATSGYSAPTITNISTNSSVPTLVITNIAIIVKAGTASLSTPVVNSARSWDYKYMEFSITNNNSVAVDLKSHFTCQSCSGDGDGECINGYYGVKTIAANSTATITYDVKAETGTTMCEDSVEYVFTFEKSGYTSSNSISGVLDYMEYEFTISVPAKPTGVGSFYVYRNGVVAVANPAAATTFMAQYGDYIYAEASAATGYTAPTIKGVSTNKASPSYATNPITISLTAGTPSAPAEETFSITTPSFSFDVATMSGGNPMTGLIYSGSGTSSTKTHTATQTPSSVVLNGVTLTSTDTQIDSWMITSTTAGGFATITGTAKAFAKVVGNTVSIYVSATASVTNTTGTMPVSAKTYSGIISY